MVRPSDQQTRCNIRLAVDRSLSLDVREGLDQMKVSTLIRARLRPLAAGLAGLVAVGTLSLVGAPGVSAAPVPSGSAESAVVNSGPGWTVKQAAGGYVVSLGLGAALPVKDDVAELFADGVDLGPAAESADGRTLTVVSADPSLAKAKKISWRWSSGGDSTATGPTALPSRSGQHKPPTHPGTPPASAADPSTVGTSPYTVADYNFGTQSIALADIGGIRGELEGRIYLPTDGRPHPVVVFLHGRHSACYNTTTLKGASGWPCPAGDTPILSYAGYDGAGEALAADGFTVVSISANAINANDNQLSPDDGAISRGQLVLDTLTMLQKADKGKPVSYHDAATDQDVTLAQALTAGQSTYPGGTITAADLVGSMNFGSIGLMGHSRGGEGVVTAATLNEGLSDPWNIKAVFELAPIDFTRDTLPDVASATLLPYCDGDVSDQQGQHFYADSRDAFSDNVLRSDIWVMGTDHDFYNTSWTPPYPGASDDWSASADPVCGTSDAALASGENIRLTAPQEDQVGTDYVAGFFEATMAGQKQFQGMFDGSGQEPPSVSDYADVRTVAQEPASLRDDVADFRTSDPQVSTIGAATATVCASKDGRTVPGSLPTCTDPTSKLTNQQVPYWTPANYAPNVPLNPMTHLTWTAAGGALAVKLTSRQQNVSDYQELTVDMSPDPNVPLGSGTDMVLSVTDSSGRTWSSPVSALNTWAVTRMPSSTSTNLGKIVLQQVHVPTKTLASAGLDLKRIAKVTFTAAVGADGSTGDGVYLSDLGFDTKGLGTPSVQTRPTVNVASTSVEEGNGAGTDQVAVYLSKASRMPVSAYLSVLGSATGKVGLAMQQVVFAPGSTCQVVDVPATGDTVAGASPTTAFKIAVSDSTNAVLGSQDFGTLTVREDDGVTGTAVPAPPVGAEGNPCAERAALGHPGTLKVSGSTVPGGSVTISGSGYRSGESVAFTLAGTALGSALAGGDGKVSLTVTIPAGQADGKAAVTAVGAGSGHSDTATVVVGRPRGAAGGR